MTIQLQHHSNALRNDEFNNPRKIRSHQASESNAGMELIRLLRVIQSPHFGQIIFHFNGVTILGSRTKQIYCWRASSGTDPLRKSKSHRLAERELVQTNRHRSYASNEVRPRAKGKYNWNHFGDWSQGSASVAQGKRVAFGDRVYWTTPEEVQRHYIAW